LPPPSGSQPGMRPPRALDEASVPRAHRRVPAQGLSWRSVRVVMTTPSSGTASGATQDRWQGSGPPTAAAVPAWRGRCMTPPRATRDRCSAAFSRVRPPVRPGRCPGRWMARRPRRRSPDLHDHVLVAVPVLTDARGSRKFPGTSPAPRQRAETRPPQPLPDPGSPSAARTCQPGACHRLSPGPPSG
jgi:hypothetical protein